MKITVVETFHLAVPSTYGGPAPRIRQWPMIQMLVVKVSTEEGLVGWGEAFGHMACATTKAAIDTLLAPLCIGRDADDIPGLTAAAERALHPYGLAGPLLFGLSGLDIALWDIAGQVRGEPVFRLLGSTVSNAETVEAYASLLRYDDAELAPRAAVDALERGFSQVKLHEADPGIVEATRQAIGDGVALMLDVNCRWPSCDAVGITRRLQPVRLRWVEEPCWPPDPRILAAMAAAGCPIAAGENAQSLQDLEGMASSSELAYLQPSAAKLGGLSGMLSARDIAARTGARLAPHSAYFGPGLVATIHFCAATDLACEWYDAQLEANPCVDIAPRMGRMSVPQQPGLGSQIDESVLARYRVG